MAHPRYTHVIFDLDGTLLNTLDDLAAACNHVCSLHGWPTFDTDRYRYKVGNGQLKLIERILPAEYAGDARMFQLALEEFRARYREHGRDMTAPYEGIDAMLDALAGAGVKCAVLTNKDHAAALPLVDHYFGAGRFALVQGRVEAFPPKPDPGITRHVLELLGADPRRTLYVGDSNVDIACGHNADMAACGVSWGFRGRAELEEAGAEFVIDTPRELIDIVLGAE